MNTEVIDHALAEEAEDGAKDEVTQKAEREERALITRWCDRVKFGRKQVEDYRKQWADDRRIARGDTGWLVDANLVGSIMEVLASFLYAKNPDVMARPSESVNRKNIEHYRDFAETIQIVVSRLFKFAGLKRKAKKWVRGSMTVGISWIRASMKTRKGPDPIVEAKMQDLDGRLKHIEALSIEDYGNLSEEDIEANKATIQANMKALEAQRERLFAEGLELDVMAPEDVTVAPECGGVENYMDAPWIALDFYKTKDAVIEITGWKDEEGAQLLSQANCYTKRPRRGEDEGEGVSKASQWTRIDDTDDDAESADGFYRVTEIWSREDGMVFTMIDGIKDRWARKPYAPITGRRFYPVFDLPCHEIDGEDYPQSDVYQLKKLQEEYGVTRSNYRTHRERSVPGIAFDESAIDPESVTKLTTGTTAEWIGVKITDPSRDINSIFRPKAYPNVDPALYSTAQITQEMEKISGAQDALQSSVAVEKTATEARIQEAGFSSRSGSRQATLEDSLSELAEYVAELALLTMDTDDVIKYAGKDAIWIDGLTADDVMTIFNITIKAGSTGKPQAGRDREIWGTLLPLMENLIDRIGHARTVGAEWAAKPWIALLEETMNRLDDPAELQKFLPMPPAPEPQDDGPDEETKAKIDKDRSSAMKDRADVIESLAPLAGPDFQNPAMLAQFLFTPADQLSEKEERPQPVAQQPAEAPSNIIQ